MPNVISKSYFKRTDFGSFGWIDKVPAGLWEVPYIVGVLSQSRSFRSRDPEKARVYHFTQPQISWLAEPLGLVVDITDYVSAWHSQTTSFRSDDEKNKNFVYSDTQPQFSWLKVPENLWEYKWFSAIESQAQSFRSDDEKNVGARYYFTQPEFSWLKVPESLWEYKWFPAISSQTDSFRSDEEKNKEACYAFTQPQISWLKVPENLWESVWFPAIKDQSGSYRAGGDRSLEVQHLADFQIGWWQGPIGFGVYDPTDHLAAWLSQSKSFRSGDELNKDVGKYFTQPEISWLKVPLDLWEYKWFSAIKAQSDSYRSSDGKKFELYHHTVPEISWLRVPLNLTEIDITEFVAAIRAQSASFVSDREKNKTAYQWHDQPLPGGWLAKVPEGLLEVQDFYSAWASQLASYRAPEGKKFEVYHLIVPQIGWLKVPAGLVEFGPSQILPVVQSQRNSFVTDKEKNKTAFQWHDQPLPGGWMAKVPESLYEVQDFYGAWYDQTQSFRAKDPEPLKVYHQTQPVFDWLQDVMSLGIVTPSGRTYVVVSEGRTYVVAAEVSRTYIIPVEDRIYDEIREDNRDYTIS